MQCYVSFLRDLEGIGDDESDVAGVDVLRDEDEDGRGERHEVPDRLQPHRQPGMQPCPSRP